MTETKRHFSKSDRVLLYVAADGKCESCGAPLSSNFHADHRVPYSKGGDTDIANAQALCPKCNLSKGGKSMLPEWTDPLRDWQGDAFQDYQSTSQRTRNYLLVATPGSGKTRVALRIAHWLFQMGRIEQLIVVTPTAPLRGQWADEAHYLAGIELEPNWAGPTVNPSMHGIAITYQLVAMRSNADAQRLIVSRKKTMVILDEIHHAGEPQIWGDTIRRAYEQAEYRLLLSGTPFRSDNYPIAFVEYDSSGVCKAERGKNGYTYDYGRALVDHVCREVLFPSFNGRIEYMLEGEVVNVTFNDTVDETGGSHRLRMALSATGGWMREVIAEAHEELQRVRQDQNDAAGLVIAMDQKHALAVADLVREVTGTSPVVAISDDPTSAQSLKDFRNHKTPWLVAVKMVSEGIDIPRLRVGVYATNVTSVLFFRQAVGRFVRMQPGYEDQTAYFYIPEDARLINFAREIKDERQHAIEEMEMAELNRVASLDRAEPCLPSPMLLQSTAEEGATIYDSDAFPPEELERARVTAAAAKVQLSEHRIDVVAVAKILRVATPLSINRSGGVPTAPTYEGLQRIRDLYTRRVLYLAAITLNGLPKDERIKQIHKECSFIVDGKWVQGGECTEQDFAARIKYVEGLIGAALKRGREDGTRN